MMATDLQWSRLDTDMSVVADRAGKFSDGHAAAAVSWAEAARTQVRRDCKRAGPA